MTTSNGVNHVGLKHGVVSDTAQCNAVIHKNVGIVLQMLADLFYIF